MPQGLQFQTTVLTYVISSRCHLWYCQICVLKDIGIESGIPLLPLIHSLLLCAGTEVAKTQAKVNLVHFAEHRTSELDAQF